ncbi:hypothetical protein GCM10009624_08760 [Gordonia sinesedis]
MARDPSAASVRLSGMDRHSVQMVRDGSAGYAVRTLVAVAEIVAVLLLTCGFPAVVAAEPGGSSGTTASAQGYGVPLPPRPTVVTGYDEPQQRWNPGHRGVDLASSAGATVVAAGDGVVRFAGVVAGKPSVSVQRTDGIITTYEPVRASVRAGERVRRGDPLGTVEAGHPGCPVAACVHWGARRGAGRTADYLDPLGLLGAIRVRLKPLGDG